VVERSGPSGGDRLTGFARIREMPFAAPDEAN
jgi:hypothetical protein